MKKLFFLKSLFSPFKPFRLAFHLGKVSVGVPYFLPRKTYKSSSGMIQFKKKIIGFNYCGLGWKTKYSDNDFRFEFSPVFSFVFFGLQFAIIIKVDNPDQYWSSWLFYELHTDKSKSMINRIHQCQTEFPQKWHTTINGVTKTTNYYTTFLKKKYLLPTLSDIRDDKLNNLFK